MTAIIRSDDTPAPKINVGFWGKDAPVAGQLNPAEDAEDNDEDAGNDDGSSDSSGY